MLIGGWGQYPKVNNRLTFFTEMDDLKTIVAGQDCLIARGMGRSYGDSALSNSTIISTQRFQRLLAFNNQTGILKCESGTTLSDILDVFVPKGWFLSVTPGTKFVSVGGAIASNVHGKNHHKVGSFASSIITFTLLLANGETVECSRSMNRELFYATLGGMGLTGFTLEVEIQLMPITSAYIQQKTIKCNSLDEVMRQFEQTSSWTYSVAWIDCLAKGESLGRSLLMLGEHVDTDSLPIELKLNPLQFPVRKKLTIPFSLPAFTLNKVTVNAFNSLYYGVRKDTAESLVDYDAFFYPLDAINHWNRIYGCQGFIQYQCAFPLATGYQAIKKILEYISLRGSGSFLAVLKLLGEEEDMLSFPQKGYTLALDFPMRKDLFSWLQGLDDITQAYDGRLYLAKDARMSQSFFEKTYDFKYQQFSRVRRKVDKNKKFQSLQSIRLGL